MNIDNNLLFRCRRHGWGYSGVRCIAAAGRCGRLGCRIHRCLQLHHHFTDSSSHFCPRKLLLKSSGCHARDIHLHLHLHDSSLQLILSKDDRDRDGLVYAEGETLLHLICLLVLHLCAHVGLPKKAAQLHALQHELLRLRVATHHQRLRRIGAEGARHLDPRLLALLLLLLHDGEEALDPDGDAHAGQVLHLLLLALLHRETHRLEHADQVVVPPAPRHRPHPRADQDRLIDDPCVVVESASQRQVEADILVGHSHQSAVLQHLLHVVDTFFRRSIAHQFFVLLEFCQQRWPRLHGDVPVNPVGDRGVQPFGIDHLVANFFPLGFVELVHCTADLPELLLRHAAHLEHTVQKLPVVHFEDEFPAVDHLEDLAHDLDAFSVRDHSLVIVSCNVNVTLVELAVSTPLDRRPITAIHFRDVVSLDRRHFVHCHITSEGAREIIAHGQELAALVLELIDQLAVLAVLPGQCRLQLQHGGVDAHSAMALEDAHDAVHNDLADGHFFGREVSHPEGGLQRRHLILHVLTLWPFEGGKLLLQASNFLPELRVLSLGRDGRRSSFIIFC